ncbi:type II secretion system F family protein [Pelagicoccus sp. SDUM812003]|uniref:type II secretion system F family protein n=1 Tax=Pelagicoccus sp. SDUM812003 TaxID=3041267 RepID=UPI00280CB063|nr:type II secretion system F family protein [Pelagicoccus sp. SDUM812003]MDQ8204967.1 type II secretion system F family protein [Pelagicoccus sp. SDUM812003]
MARVSDMRMADWFEQVAQGLETGLNYANALTLASDLPGGVNARITKALRSGKLLTRAIDESGLRIRVSEFAMLQAAESSGNLPRVLRRLAKSRVDRAKIKRKIWMTLVYPAILLHLAAVVFSLPYLVDGDDLRFLVSAGMVIVPFWLGFLFLLSLARYAPSLLRALARLAPLFAGFRKKWALGTLCEVLGQSLASGVSAERAWESATLAADHPHVARLGQSALEAIRSGAPASEGIRKFSGKSENALLELYRSGEMTGQLDRNLDAAGQRFFQDAKRRLGLAIAIYPKLFVAAIFAYVGYHVIQFFSAYYQSLLDMSV